MIVRSRKVKTKKTKVHEHGPLEVITLPEGKSVRIRCRVDLHHFMFDITRREALRLINDLDNVLFKEEL